MINKKTAKLMLEKWKAELAGLDRSMPNVASNFDMLFGDWYHAGISFEDAYDLVKEAVKAHYPSASITRGSYRESKAKKLFGKSEKEYYDDWCQKIHDIGMQVFYNYFQIDGEADTPKEKPTYGSMSTAEYLKQRRYADSHPTINPDDIPDFEPIDDDDLFDGILNDDCDVNLDEV